VVLELRPSGTLFTLVAPELWDGDETCRDDQLLDRIEDVFGVDAFVDMPWVEGGGEGLLFTPWTHEAHEALRLYLVELGMVEEPVPAFLEQWYERRSEEVGGFETARRS